MQAGLMLPDSVRGDSRREESRGRERERQRVGEEKERLQACSKWEFPVYCNDDVLKMLTVIKAMKITLMFTVANGYYK